MVLIYPERAFGVYKCRRNEKLSVQSYEFRLTMSAKSDLRCNLPHQSLFLTEIKNGNNEHETTGSRRGWNTPELSA